MRTGRQWPERLLTGRKEENGRTSTMEIDELDTLAEEILPLLPPAASLWPQEPDLQMLGRILMAPDPAGQLELETARTAEQAESALLRLAWELAREGFEPEYTLLDRAGFDRTVLAKARLKRRRTAPALIGTAAVNICARRDLDPALVLSRLTGTPHGRIMSAARQGVRREERFLRSWQEEAAGYRGRKPCFSILVRMRAADAFRLARAAAEHRGGSITFAAGTVCGLADRETGSAGPFGLEMAEDFTLGVQAVGTVSPDLADPYPLHRIFKDACWRPDSVRELDLQEDAGE